MTRDEALLGLTSAEMGERLKAARFFALHAVSADRRKLRAALRKEMVPWIRRALERSLNKAGPAEVVHANGSSDPSAHVLAELRAKAINEVASTIVHELSTIIGRLRLTVPEELDTYDESRTKVLVDSLATLLGGIRNLKTAVGRADYVECNLALQCRETCADFEEAGEIFHFAGPAPFMVEIDPGLFKLALANSGRNAVEEAFMMPEGERSVTLNWGWAGHEFWVAVLDSGFGFERDPASMIDLGKSTKAEHIGFGLATAKQAMQAMEGDIYPSNTDNGGARVELRWFGSHEDLIR